MKYYLHYSNSFQDEKITKLYIKYGYEGLGLFYTLLEKLAAQEKPINNEVLKKQLNIGKRLEKVWNFMHEIDLISSKNNETFNENLLNFSEKYLIKKEKTRKKVSEWRKNQEDEKDVTDYKKVRNRPKYKITKDNIIKDKIKDKQGELHSLLKKIFLEFYYKRKGFEYYWEGKDAGLLTKLINKLKFHCKEEEKLPEIFQFILEKNNNKWINENLSIAILNSKFNDIIANIKGKKSMVNQMDEYYERISKDK